MRKGVYPRVCGGTARIALAVSDERGLSPRVRGNRYAFHQFKFDRRSIPACAGEPHCAHFSLSSGTVYPRVCGGTTYSCAVYAVNVGLSPRVRGNP